MSKILNWIWGKKRKDGKHHKHREQADCCYVTDDLEQSQMPKSNLKRKCKYSVRKNLIDPEYLDVINGISRNKKNRSYPVSPVRMSIEDQGYFSDQNPNRLKKSSLFKNNSAVVLAAAVPHNSFSFNPENENNINFPYRIPVNVPRRSTMCYGVDCNGDLIYNEHKELLAEKLVEDYAVPSTSQNSHDPLLGLEKNSKTILHKDRKVSIKLSEDNLKNINQENFDCETKPIRKTVVRLRPGSSAQFIPKESVKVMTLRSNDQTFKSIYQREKNPNEPLSTPKHKIHSMPFRASKESPILSTPDGRQITPLTINKVRKLSSNSNKISLASKKILNSPNLDKNPYVHAGEPIVYAVPVVPRRSNVGRPVTYQPVSNKSNARKFIVEKMENKENEEVPVLIPFEESVFYAAPVICRRSIDGRSTFSQKPIMDIRNHQNRIETGIEKDDINDFGQYQREEMSLALMLPLDYSSKVSQMPIKQQSTKQKKENETTILKKVKKTEQSSESSTLDQFEAVEESILGESTDRNQLFHTTVESSEPIENDALFFSQKENKAQVYTVPVFKTRGRTKSIVQQSAKSLTKNQPVYSKNMRNSMATDVFSAEVQRKSFNQPKLNYVNMEKGQAMLVSEFLNPITSLFISDLKDPVPKDPLAKPKEANVWVKPRPHSGRSSFSKQPPKTHRQVQIVYPEIITEHKQKKGRSRMQDESSSYSSDDSIDVYEKKSKASLRRRTYNKQNVYAAKVPDATFAYSPRKQEEQPPFKENGNSAKYLASVPMEDFCGLACEEPEMKSELYQTSIPEMVSITRQKDLAEKKDIKCSPTDKLLEDVELGAEAGSKLRWRIVIKRGDKI